MSSGVEVINGVWVRVGTTPEEVEELKKLPPTRNVKIVDGVAMSLDADPDVIKAEQAVRGPTKPSVKLENGAWVSLDPREEEREEDGDD